MMATEKGAANSNVEKYLTKNQGGYIQRFWNDRIMERFIKANLFIICCIAAGLLLIVYLGAFSCEVSWILEAHGDLPYSAYILCASYFIVFVATTILIHGLVTGLSWGLFAWSFIIGLLSIPELIFVMIMTTQHWGLQSIHGLTELISYLIRLVINCFALICVIPTGLRWRRESQVLSQLQDLATRLQLQTPPPSVPISKGESRRGSKRQSFNHISFENAGYQITEPVQYVDNMKQQHQQHQQQQHLHQQQGLSAFNNSNSIFGSQNEFNASVFASPVQMQQFNNTSNNRAQSLMDLRCTLPGMYNPRYVLESSEDKNAKYFNITIDDLKNNLQDSNKTPSLISSSANDPIYCSIEPKPVVSNQRLKTTDIYPNDQHLQQQKLKSGKKLSRNCISLENLDGITKAQNDMTVYGHNLLQNYTEQQRYYLAMLGYLGQKTAVGEGFCHRPSSTSPINNLALTNIGGALQAYAGMAPAILPVVQPLQRRNSQNMQYYGGFGYANFNNPYIMANSKLSLGNESDDYRRWRDVAL